MSQQLAPAHLGRAPTETTGPSSTGTEAWQPERRTQSLQLLLRRVLMAVAVGGAAACVLIWLNGGGVSDVNSPSALLTTIGRLTGLFAAYLLLIQVLFMSRLPFLQFAIPFDRLTVIHRLNGKVCLYLILAHVLFITAGYALVDKFSLLNEFWTVVTTYSGMIAALIGTVLLNVVVVTSLVIIRKRLRYELWFLVHVLAYAGVILTWFHEIPTGNDFVTSSLAAAFWTGLYVATLQLVIMFRVLLPAFGAAWHGLRVTRVESEPGGATSIWMSGRNVEWLSAESGQFFQWRFLDRKRWYESHPFSLSMPSKDRHLRITAKSVGDFTSNLSTLKPGTFVIAEGPLGGFTAASRRRRKVAYIAGGVGITPIRALMEESRGDAVLVYRAISEADLILRDEVEVIGERCHIPRHYVIGDHRDEMNRHMMSAGHLREIVPDIADREIFLCGPPAMVAVIKKSLDDLGIEDADIHVEVFAF